ncbi:MAG: lysylphosphatidylglycerol synthase domain-containing protein [Planctomycetota bacterium]
MVAGLVVWFVYGTLRQSIAEFSATAIRPNPWLLFAAGVAYAAALAPMAWFWRQTLLALGQPSGWRAVLRAYCLGHLGKYVPGKGLVVVLRTGAIRQAGGQTAPIAASVFVETLTMMSVGGVLACVLLTTHGDGAAEPWLAALAAGLAVAAAAPTLPPVIRRLVRRLARVEVSPAEAQASAPANTPSAGDPLPSFAGRLTWRLLGKGWLAAALAWTGLAGSLWLTLRSLDAGFPLTLVAAAYCLLAVTLPVVAGFLSLLPGGLLVRDGLMLQLLTGVAGVAEPVALAATVLLRVVWIVSEAAACAIVEAVHRGSAGEPPEPKEPSPRTR